MQLNEPLLDPSGHQSVRLSIRLSVRLSIRLSVRPSIHLPQKCFPRFSTPAHPSATNAAVYTALFFSPLHIGDYIRASDRRSYCLHERKVNWAKARTICEKEKRGSRLAIINNEDSFTAIKELFPEKQFWLAGSDADSEGAWYWIDENGAKSHNGFERSAWLNNEPNGDTTETARFGPKLDLLMFGVKPRGIFFVS